MADNVRELPSGLQRAIRTATIHRVRRIHGPDGRGACFHDAIELDEAACTVTCRRCGRVIDAFGFLVYLCNEEHALLFARHDLKRVTEELAELKRQIRNAKAALRRTK